MAMTISKNKVREDYFMWLCSLVGKDKGDTSFVEILRDLHTTVFTWTIPDDANRAEDGMKLRVSFSDTDINNHISPDDLHGLCTMLEMLVALAIKMEQLLYEPHYGDRTARWFWEMIHNLGILPSDQPYDQVVVMKILRNVLNRAYSSSGKGGLFPLRHADCNQREIEIWYQAMRYLDEKFPRS